MRRFISCRGKRFSFLILILLILFLCGNIVLIKRFHLNPSPDVTKTTWTNVKKDLTNNNQLFQQKFEDYRKQGEQKFLTLPDDHLKDDFNIRVVTTHKKSTLKSSLAPEIKTQNLATKISQVKKAVMALLVISCNRPSVGRCLDRILKFKPSNMEIPVIVSQDCGDSATSKVIESYGSKVKHIKQPELEDVKNVPPSVMRWMGYYKISRHFKWALGQVFSDENIDSVVIVEDDIDIAPDFFDYFLATRPLLNQDETIYCVSAWNDNGKIDSVDGSAIDLLYRSDFFPGLGWLITRKIWSELGPKWPLGFWDDWMRAPAQRKGRVCIRPEISRTKTFGRIGVSQGQFYDQYLKYIKLNSEPYPFLDYDLSYLKKQKYDTRFLETVYSVPERQVNEVHTSQEEFIRISYRNKDEFEILAKRFGLMSDLKAGVPRTAYKGVVSFFKSNKRIYLAPPDTWKGYDERS